jgi:cytochrome c556
MGDLTYSMSLDPPDRYTEPARRAKQVAEVANQMVKTASDVVAAEKEFKLDAKDREVFLSLAQKLKQSATEVNESASRQDYEGTRSAISRMQSTCNACHSLFRTMMPITK